MGFLNDIRTIQQARLNEGFKTEEIRLRVTPEEKREFEMLAKCQSLKVSQFIRWVVLSKYKNDFIRD